MHAKSLSYPCLRRLAVTHLSELARNGRPKFPSLDDGWLATYDVKIAGRRFTLWSQEVSSSCTRYAITIDKRVRQVLRSNIFAPALDTWETLTGITYLLRYDSTKGQGLYGHHLPVEIMEGRSVALLNYHPGQILQTEEHFALVGGDRGRYTDSWYVPVSGDAEALVGQKVAFVALDPAVPYSKTGLLQGEVVGHHDGLAVVQYRFSGYSGKPHETIVRERLPRHLYRLAA